MPDAPMPADIAVTDAGHHLQVAIDGLRDPSILTDEVVRDHWDTRFIPVSARRTQLARPGGLDPAFEVVEYGQPMPRLAYARLRTPDGRTWRVGTTVVAGTTLAGPTLILPVPDQYVVRPAVPEDGPALAALERLSPIVAGDVSVVYDRGDEDYFAGERLMGATALVIEEAGRIVALLSAIPRTIRVGGRDRVNTYVHRLRTHPDARGGGITAALTWATYEQNSPFSTGPYAFIAAGNEAGVRRMTFPQPPLSVLPAKVVIDTASHAGPPVGRTASEADAGRLVELFNRSHERKELFVPYTVESLAERLTRAPELYSWPQIRMSEHAALGVLPWAFRVLREEAGVRTEDDRALAFDFGCDAGQEDELIALLRGACAELAAAGISELSIFTSSGATANAHLGGLAKRIEPYRAFVLMAEPPDLAERGIYVDQLYF